MNFKQSVILAGLLLLSTQVLAEPKIVTPDSDDSTFESHVEEIEKLHLEAEKDVISHHFDAAIQKYEDIILLEPDDETAYANLGSTYLIIGNYAQAEESFWNALHINPQNELALAGIAKIRDPDALRDEIVYPETDPDQPAQ